MKILVVENPSDLHPSVALGLREFGYHVDVVTDGEQAIAQAHNCDYDVIILDLILPKESSLLVLHEIRESDREVEILILSAKDQIHDRVTALIQGADDYLVKPFSFDELHTSIQSLMQRKRHRGSADEHPATATDASGHLNRLIENLLKLCRCEQGEIELVISEIKLARLLEKACAKLAPAAAQNQVNIVQPTGKLPTLLVDARWTEHLLTNLLTNAVTQSPSGSDVTIISQCNSEFCTIEIENQMSDSLTSNELKSMFKDYCNREDGDDQRGSIAQFSLVKAYTDYMNLGLNASITDANRLRVRVSNIKVL